MLRTLSRLTGIGVRFRFCGIERRVVQWYARHYRVNLEEAEFPLEHYRTLQQFFTRRLKAGARTLETPPVSPIDGVLRNVGVVQEGTLLQVKGVRYSLSTLLGRAAPELEGAAYFNFYLSPRDYHRIHVPLDGAIRGIRHIPGKLWPVNAWALHKVPSLFAVNERVVVEIESSLGMVQVVMVGALNVGSIALAFDELETNSWTAPWSPRPVTERVYPRPIQVKAGDELGLFRMGSAVVLIVPGVTLPTEQEELNLPVLMGMSLRGLTVTQKKP